MKNKKIYGIQGVFYTLLGFLLLFNLKSPNVLGATIGTQEISISIKLFFGVFFLAGGVALLIITRK